MKPLRRLARGSVLLALIGATGCGDFFTKDSSSGGNTGGGTGNPTSGVNRMYVLSSAAKTINGFTIGTGTLTAVPGNTIVSSFAPVSAAVTPSGKYLYAASAGTISVYNIAADGSLSQNAAAYIATVAALAISPDGQWMFGLDTLNQVLDEWQINADGTLTVLTPISYSTAGGVLAPRALVVSPSGGAIFAALGTAGEAGFTLNTSTGLVVQTQTLQPINTQTSDAALAVNASSSLLFLARSGSSGGLSVYTIGSGAALAPTAGSPYSTGAGAASIALEGTGKYVYVANRSDSTISGFQIATGGALTALSGSPFAAGNQVTALGIDRSGQYLVAASPGGSPDVALYGFDATVPGKLNSAATATLGTTPAGASVVALTR